MAHRGGALLWPENSLSAVRNAALLAIDEIEIDVHLSRDGIPVVIHDATLGRTTTGAGAVGDRSAMELAQMPLRGAPDQRVPRLAEVAALLRPGACGLRLEIKADADGRPYPGIVDACLAVLDAHGMRSRTVAIAFAPLTVAACAAAGGFAGTALLLDARAWRGMGTLGAVALCRACGTPELGLPIGECDSGGTGALRDAGLGVGAWGADDAATLQAAFALGLDAVTTDDPVLASRLAATQAVT